MAKGDDDKMINKKETPKRIVADRELALKVAEEQMKKYDSTLKKLAKN